VNDDEADEFMKEWGEWAKWSDARSMVQSANYMGYTRGKEDGIKAASASHAAEVEALRSALERLLESDPDGAIANASETELCEAANDHAADPVIREQAAAILQARAALKGD
jgi:hypothetical protein